MKKLFIAILVAGLATSAFAKGGSVSVRGGSFASSRAFSSYGRPSYVPPRAVYATPPRTVNKTVVVQQNVTHVSNHSSSGGGFFSSFAGSFAGSAVGQWLFAPKAAPAPTNPPLTDCSLEQFKNLDVCKNVAPQNHK